MKVFVTGATGFIGTRVVSELIQNGYQVLGLARSSEGAALLTLAGAEPHWGTIQDLDTLKSGARDSDAVIHLAFNHDFANFAQNSQEDAEAIRAMGEVLAGTEKPFIGTAGVLGSNLSSHQPLDEDDEAAKGRHPRQSEPATLSLLEQGVHGIVMRLSQIHNTRRQGLVSFLIQIAREKGRLAYVGDGSQRWAAAHVDDTARLYRLALEQGKPGSKWHAVGETGVSMKEIATTLGHRLGLPVDAISPEEASDYFGGFAFFVREDSPTSNTKTRERLGWTPTGPGLLEDLRNLEVA